MAQVRESPRELHDLATGSEGHNTAAQLAGVAALAEAGALGACEHTCVNVLVGMCESVRVCVCKVCVCVCVCAESLCLSACVL